MLFLNGSIRKFWGHLPENLSNSLSLLVLCFVPFVLGSCAKTTGEDSRITIRFPDGKSQASNTSEKVSAMNFDFSLACYAVNVTAETIPLAPPRTCEIPIGVFAGFIPAGGQISLMIPNGYKRKLEVFAYQRSSLSESCAALSGGFGSVNKSKVARVGEVLSFDTVQPSVELVVSVSPPPSGVNILTQYSLSNACALAGSPSGEGTARVTLGGGTLTSSSFKIVGSVSAQTNEQVLTSSSFKIELSRSK